MKKYDLTNSERYYIERNKFENSMVSKLSHKQRVFLHPLLLKIISYKNKRAGFKINTLYDKRIETEKPKIFCVTHIGKFDVEVVSEVVKEHYYLLSGDFENMRGTVEEKFLGLNGVVYIREDDKADRKLSKEKMVNVLKLGGNMMYFPEGTWNLTPNLPVLQCAYGIIEVAMKANATIIPIGIEQYDKNFYVAVGENFDVSNFSEDKKIDAIHDLRGILAGLKWDIWENIPFELSSKMDKYGFDKHIEERLKEWSQSLDALVDSIFKPKGVFSEKEVFSFLKDMHINENNIFLVRDKIDYIKKHRK